MAGATRAADVSKVKAALKYVMVNVFTLDSFGFSFDRLAFAPSTNSGGFTEGLLTADR
jgi:hypothetical protein